MTVRAKYERNAQK